MSDANHFPEAFNRLLMLWKEIKADFFDPDDTSASDMYESGLRTASWAWLPDIQKVSPEEVDRKRDMLLGPLFCSAEDPWPDNDGEPMIPLAQIDLANASSLCGVDVGNGLLQVFCPVKDKLGQKIYTRVIERESVTGEALTDAPIFSDDIKGFASVGWAQTSSDNRSLHGGECLQITGYTEKKFTLWMPSLFDGYDLTNLDAGMRAKIDEFEKIISSNADAWSPGGFHLFGAFYPIQYYPAERGNVLLTLESEHGFNFGDGQGQIFYNFYKKYPEMGAYFSFDWSCY